MFAMASLAAPKQVRFKHYVPAVGLALACIVVTILLITTRPQVGGDAETAATLDRILLIDGLLPRAVIALVAGAALGLSGALLQRVLGNPIADASTLGVASGAQLALTLGLGLSPVLAELSRQLVAFAGGFAAIVIVLALSWRRGLDPVSVALSGMTVSMIAASLGDMMVLARGEYAMSIHLWGAGVLNQQDWRGVVSLAPCLGIGIPAAVLLLRPLALLSLDDTSAKSLGMALHGTRFSILILAVWLVASVTATVGIIGFLGLAAPVIARICGARTTGQTMVAAPLAGAAVLFLADGLTQLAGPGFSDLAPTGAATAFLGGPLLLVLLPRVHGFAAVLAAAPAGLRHIRRPASALAILAGLLVVVFCAALAVGPGLDGVTVATGRAFWDLLPFRLPRLLAAGGAGAMLGGAGLIMQRMTGNPIASPELLGVSSGGGAGLALVLVLFGFPSMPVMLVGMTLGALAAFMMMIAMAGRSGFSAERLLLAGIAVSAFCMAVVGMVLAQGDMRSYVLLAWISGSTSRAGSFEGWTAVISLVLLIAPLFLLTRWLTVLPLGTPLARGIGLPVLPSRLILAVIAATMTAIASFLVGPLSLTGLIAPHLARLLGFQTVRAQLAAALLIGAGVLLAADWLSRVAIYPYQVPLGLFAALIGGPYLLWTLGRRQALA